jgi:4-alpha-glucanotransferase
MAALVTRRRVRQLAEGAARHGADAVALSPVHSLFAADPGRYGPYSPSSRLFLNPLFADPEIVFGAERLAQHRLDSQPWEQAPLVDWRPAAEAKLALMRRLFEDFESRDVSSGSDLAKAFDGFLREGGDLLQGHAVFEALHGKWLGGELALGFWRDWPAAFRHGPLTRRRSGVGRLPGGGGKCGSFPPVPAMARGAVVRGGPGGRGRGPV